MKTPMRLLLLMAIATTLTLAGCSYQPARVHSRPLIEVDGASGHRDYRREDRHYRQYQHHDRYQKRHHRRAERGSPRRYRGNSDYRGHGRFCPPGLRKQGRC